MTESCLKNCSVVKPVLFKLKTWLEGKTYKKKRIYADQN